MRCTFHCIQRCVECVVYLLAVDLFLLHAFLSWRFNYALMSAYGLVFAFVQRTFIHIGPYNTQTYKHALTYRHTHTHSQSSTNTRIKYANVQVNRCRSHVSSLLSRGERHILCSLLCQNRKKDLFSWKSYEPQSGRAALCSVCLYIE